MKLQVTCDWCGKAMVRKSSQLHTHNYCSRACLGKANGQRMKKTNYKVCSNCGKTFVYTGNHGSRNKHFFCSEECYLDFKTKKQTVTCEWCGKTFEKKRSDIARSDHNLCSRGCYLDFINFEKAGAKNQRVAGKSIYRVLAEMELGRKLSPDEEVHHINGNHTDHSANNLQVLSKSEHSKIHAAKKVRDEHGRFIKSE